MFPRDTTQIALRSANCQSPFRGLSSRCKNKAKWQGEELGWFALDVNFKAAGGDVFSISEPAF